MPLPQDISPVNSELMDTLVRTNEVDWIETKPGMAYMKLLWHSPESGQWMVLYRWMKGYQAPSHKHLSAAHVFMLSGKLEVRDGVLEAGDYLYEANGMVHGATTALEDTEYLFLCDGAVLFFDEDGFTAYKSWEELKRQQDAAVQASKAAAE